MRQDGMAVVAAVDDVAHSLHRAVRLVLLVVALLGAGYQPLALISIAY